MLKIIHQAICRQIATTALISVALREEAVINLHPIFKDR
jgi:hypothetical protein